MSVDHNRWRDQQLNGFKNLSNSWPILEQESVMLNFVKAWPDVVWSWIAPETKFKKICQEHIAINNIEYNGVIVFGPVLNQQTTQDLVNTITQLTANMSQPPSLFVYIIDPFDFYLYNRVRINKCKQSNNGSSSNNQGNRTANKSNNSSFNKMNSAKSNLKKKVCSFILNLFCSQ